MSDDAFARHRRLLFTVAYEMLGSACDAEDVVQETWLRWADVDQATVRDPRAYLVRIATRQALNRLRTLSRRREDCVGEWLPEPLVTDPDVAADVDLAESLSIAMLTVLETLGPAERAVFVLREVFDTPYEEIAEAVGKSPAAVRQIAHRAREHVAARRPRVSVSATEQQEALERFLAAIRQGDLQGLLDVLAPDVVLVADGGGVVPAARRPVEGGERVVGLLTKGLRSVPFEATAIWLNGSPAIRIDAGPAFNAVVASPLRMDGSPASTSSPTPRSWPASTRSPRWRVPDTPSAVLSYEAALGKLDGSRHTVIYLGNPAIGARGVYAAALGP